MVNKREAILALLIFPESTLGIYLCNSENTWPCLTPGRTEMNYFSDPVRAFLYSLAFLSCNSSFATTVADNRQNLVFSNPVTGDLASFIIFK